MDANGNDVKGQAFELPTGARVDTDNGDYVVKDSSGNIVFRWNESAAEWQLNGTDLTGVGSLSAEEVDTRNYLKTSRDNRGHADMQGGPGPMDALAANFEDLSNWTADSGQVVGDAETVYRGSQSGYVGESPFAVRYSPPSPLDVTGLDASLAVRPENDQDIVFNLVLFDGNGNEYRYQKAIFADSHPDGWARIDGEPSRETGFDPTNVTEILLTTSETAFYADSLRFIPKRFDNGKFMFTFDDAVDDQYDTFFRVLDEYGFRATVSVPSNVIGDAGNLTDAEITEMVDHGWEVAGHFFGDLNGLSESEQRDILKSTKSELMANGYGDITTFCYAGGNFDATTVELMQEYYHLGMTALVSSTASAFPSSMTNPYFLNRRKYGSGNLSGPIDNAIATESVAAFYAHGTDEMTESDLRSICDYLDANSDSIDVVTPRDILPDYAIGTL